MSNLQLNDTMPFGKYKGKTIESVYKENVAYLVWLRAQKEKSFFAPEIHPLLDDAIRSTKNLRGTYKEWGPTIEELEAKVKASAKPVVEISTDNPPWKTEPEAVRYAETWGAF